MTRLRPESHASRRPEQRLPADEMTALIAQDEPMLRITLKGLWAHKLRFALTGLSVILGVAFMAGTMILTDTMAAPSTSC